MQEEFNKLLIETVSIFYPYIAIKTADGYQKDEESLGAQDWFNYKTDERLVLIAKKGFYRDVTGEFLGVSTRSDLGYTVVVITGTEVVVEYLKGVVGLNIVENITGPFKLAKDDTFYYVDEAYPFSDYKADVDISEATILVEETGLVFIVFKPQREGYTQNSCPFKVLGLKIFTQPMYSAEAVDPKGDPEPFDIEIKYMEGDTLRVKNIPGWEFESKGGFVDRVPIFVTNPSKVETVIGYAVDNNQITKNRIDLTGLGRITEINFKSSLGFVSILDQSENEVTQPLSFLDITEYFRFVLCTYG